MSHTTPRPGSAPITDDLRISDEQQLRSPESLIDEIPVGDVAARTVSTCRDEVRRALSGQDDRLVVVVGPCSIHDPEAALEYAGRLRDVRERLASDLILVMRVYFEKPRTTIGWKGLINDPDMDGSFRINEGLAHRAGPAARHRGARRARGRRVPRPRQSRSTSPISSAGAPSGRAPPRARATASSPPACPARSASRTARRAACRSPWMRSVRPATRTTSCR